MPKHNLVPCSIRDMLLSLPIANPGEAGGNWPNGTFTVDTDMLGNALISFYSPSGDHLGGYSIRYHAKRKPTLTALTPSI